ncbi:hypothetical protein EPN16_02355 [bacterium]|nr:MAG: hypothetical protein EPN16_02355 [bacterium]
MLTVEDLGEALYKSLSLRTKETDLRLIYERLALNELKTAKCIQQEILATGMKRGVLVNRLALYFTKIICKMLTARQIGWILKSAINRKVYSKWYNRYKNSNQDFWDQLLSHENLQLELLKPVWNREKRRCDNEGKGFF